MTSRKGARRDALFVLYQWDVTGKPECAGLDARINEASRDWSAERLGALERNILRIALWELDRGGVPVEVAIDEAVSLAKRYASEEAGRLVNGILGRVVREAAR